MARKLIGFANSWAAWIAPEWFDGEAADPIEHPED